MAEGFAYQGEVSKHSGKPRGEPSAELPTTAFVICLQNHDQIGNRAMGERLTALADPQALRAATVLLLLSPFIPLLFMGEEVESQTPFQFFTDHNEELAELVREGRRSEFKHFAAFKDPALREQIPDPNAEATFEASVPDVTGDDGFMRKLLAVRRGASCPACRAAAAPAWTCWARPRWSRAGGWATGRRCPSRSTSATRSRRCRSRKATRSSRARSAPGTRDVRHDAGALRRGMDRAASMSLHALAQAAGLATRWKDVHDQWHDVGDDTLRLVLAALGLPADTDCAVADSLASLRHPAHLPPLVTGEAGGELTLPGLRAPGDRARARRQRRTAWTDPVRLPAGTGYHTLRTSAGQADARRGAAPLLDGGGRDAGSAGRAWGLAAQLYSLRRPGDGGLGDYGALADFVRNAAAHGAAAVAISPVHAQFSATLDRFSPYSPSSRTLLNVLHARLDLPADEAAVLEAEPLVDWPAATRLRLDALDAMFAQAEQGGALWDAFQRFRADEGAAGGPRPLRGAARHIIGDGGPWHWRHWPDGLADAASPAVARFAASTRAR